MRPSNVHLQPTFFAQCKFAFRSIECFLLMLLKGKNDVRNANRNSKCEMSIIQRIGRDERGIGANTDSFAMPINLKRAAGIFAVF
jgi:hypothetical protein